MRCRRRSRKTADIWNTWTRGKCRNLMRMKCTMHLRFFPLFFRLFLERLGCFTQILFLHFLVIRFLLWVKLNSCQNYYTLGLFQELKKTHKRTDPFVVLQSNTTVRSLALTYWGRKNTHVCQERSAVIRTHAYARTHTAMTSKNIIWRVLKVPVLPAIREKGLVIFMEFSYFWQKLKWIVHFWGTERSCL